jgi:prevent-host-death family protein
MPKSYSIAEARNDLPGVIHDVERGGPVKITRRGKPVAVLISIQEYDRLAVSRPSFADAYEAWKAGVDFAEVAVEPDHFAGLRDRSPGREVKL